MTLDRLQTAWPYTTAEIWRPLFDRFQTDHPDLPIVLVTHHVEEIPQSFTHALILGGGGVLGQGPITTTLNSRTLTQAFGRPFNLSRRNGKYRLMSPK